MPEIIDGNEYFLIMSCLIAAHGFICLTTTSANILYIFRYFLVWILIFGTAFVWFYYKGEVLVAPFGASYQTENNTRLLVLAGFLSLCGSLIGWHFALLNFKFECFSQFILTDKNRKNLRVAGIFLTLLFSLLYVWKAGGFVGGDKTYADGKEGFDLVFGVFNIFHFTGISLLLLASIRLDQFSRRYIAFAIFTLILGMAAGSRADFLPQAFIIFLLIFNREISAASKERSYSVISFYGILFIFVLVIAYLIATYIALWRSGLPPTLALEQISGNSQNILINEIYGHQILYLETGNMMLGGLYSAIVQVGEGGAGLLAGESYFNYLLITPPAFLGLPRPLGLEWATALNGVTMTIGGIFEVAEAYWNFGLIGCFVVSLVISYIFGWILRRGLRASNYFFLVWYIVFGLHGFRSIWYQNFSYFRLMTVMILIYFVAIYMFKFFIQDRRHI